MKQILFLVLALASVAVSAQSRTYRHTIHTKLNLEAEGNLQFRHDLATEIDSTENDTLQAVVYKIVLVDTDSGSVVVLPPASPVAGDWFGVVDSRSNANTHPIKVEFGGAKYHGTSTDLTINGAKASGTLVYVNAAVGWIKLD
jgi:hypothetical protein